MNDLPVDKLGPYPLLQLAGAIVVLAALALAVYRGTRDRTAASPTSVPNEQRYFFDGPMGEALKLLRDLRNISNEIKEHVAPLGELGRNTVKELGEIKDEAQAARDELKNTRRR
jgi:hypothetical protein